VATGAHKSQKMGLPGDDAAGVMLGLDFLGPVNLGEKVAMGRKTVVVGGDAVATRRFLGNNPSQSTPSVCVGSPVFFFTRPHWRCRCPHIRQAAPWRTFRSPGPARGAGVPLCLKVPHEF